MDWWRDAKLGLFIHWGPYTRLQGRWQGKPLGWCAEWARHSARIPDQAYRELATDWNPTHLDTDRWADLARQAGMGYVVLTAKHHDGFCLYDSAHTRFSLRHARAGRDALAELQHSCSARGLKLGCYYSPRDWDHADYMPYQAFAKPGPRYGGRFGFPRNALTGAIDMFGEKPEYVLTPDDFHDCGCQACIAGLPLTTRATAPPVDVQRYLAYYHAQLDESISRYDPALLWFDGCDFAPEHTNGVELIAKLRTQRPDLIINDRSGVQADFGIHEGKIPATGEARDWESCQTLSGSWGWDPLQPVTRSADEVIRMLCATVGRGGNLLLNVGPDDQGVVHDAEVAILRRLGAWMQRFGAAIRGSRATTHQATDCHVLRNGADLQVLWTGAAHEDLLLPGLCLPAGCQVELPGYSGFVPWRTGADGQSVLLLSQLPAAAVAGEPALALRLRAAAVLLDV